jgi:hypothetical protein
MAEHVAAWIAEIVPSKRGAWAITQNHVGTETPRTRHIRNNNLDAAATVEDFVPHGNDPTSYRFMLIAERAKRVRGGADRQRSRFSGVRALVGRRGGGHPDRIRSELITNFVLFRVI